LLQKRMTFNAESGGTRRTTGFSASSACSALIVVFR
jgi:hypothetical protein